LCIRDREIMKEPLIRIGIVGAPVVNGSLDGLFSYRNKQVIGPFEARPESNTVVLKLGGTRFAAKQIKLVPLKGSNFSVSGVRIGIGFHWDKTEKQVFKGALILECGPEGNVQVINEILIEEYLKSVISSEMSASAPVEFLKAHAIASRSWLAAMLNRKKDKTPVQSPALSPETAEHIKWYDREDHGSFDVCADDHCQRYQGVSKIISGNAAQAAVDTRGVFLVANKKICDARYYKCCGGITENFSSAWADAKIEYLSSVCDSQTAHKPVGSEEEARLWLHSRPDVFCNTKDEELLGRILPENDRGTDFFRWQVSYSREELEEIVRQKSGIDFGTIKDLVPVERGPSGRIIKLEIRGSDKTAVVGKELEIRRWLSPAHLLSSAFCVSVELDDSGLPIRFVLDGAGWGHGVGMCQIGAAVMASRGYSAAEILTHYFPGASLEKLY
jgi:stage II sporulation protein D